MTYKVHLDGYNLMPFLKGEEKVSPRKEFLYWTDDGNVAALALQQLEDHIPEAERPRNARLASAHTSNCVCRWSGICAPIRSSARIKKASATRKWQFEHMFAFAPAAAFVGEWLQSFKEFPPRQKPGSFSLDRVLESITKGAGDK